LIVVQHDLTAVARQNQLIGYRLAMLTEIEQLQIEPDEAAPINNLFKPSHHLVDTRFTDNFGRNATCAADAARR
jgi:hypothetical protein